MNLKKGDYVIYKKTGQLVCNTRKKPLKVRKIEPAEEFYGHVFKKIAQKFVVVYENGQFDFIENVEKASPLLLELL